MFLDLLDVDFDRSPKSSEPELGMWSESGRASVGKVSADFEGE
jgi:hypothetical protein